MTSALKASLNGWSCQRARFHNNASPPPGRSTRAISWQAGAVSNQWNASPTTTAAAAPSGSGIASAVPAIASASGTRARSSASIVGEGSTAITFLASGTSARVSLPVPAARSTIVASWVRPSSRTRWRTASAG